MIYHYGPVPTPEQILALAQRFPDSYQSRTLEIYSALQLICDNARFTKKSAAGFRTELADSAQKLISHLGTSEVSVSDFRQQAQAAELQFFATVRGMQPTSVASFLTSGGSAMSNTYFGPEEYYLLRINNLYSIGSGDFAAAKHEHLASLLGAAAVSAMLPMQRNPAYAAIPQAYAQALQALDFIEPASALQYFGLTKEDFEGELRSDWETAGLQQSHLNRVMQGELGAVATASLIEQRSKGVLDIRIVESLTHQNQDSTRNPGGP